MISPIKFLLPFALLPCLFSLKAVAQSPGRFIAVGRMTTPRMGHTATLLKDGRVLITGGWASDIRGKRTFLASAELYDPSTGTFTPTGDMTTVRESHSATLLPDGRVLIAGGFEATDHANPPGSTSSSEVYDPATGLFTRSGNMNAKHGYHSADLLGDGRVLIWPTAELYDPSSGAFTALGTANANGAITILKDGRIVAADNGISTYTITGDSLTLVANLPGREYSGQSMTLLQNGQILIAGGAGSAFDSTITDASLFDPLGGSLRSTGLLLFSREGHTATLLANGHVLIVGGYDGDAYDTGVPILTDAEDYDPSTGSFTSAGRVVYMRHGNTATMLLDETVLIAGGTSDTATTELYVPFFSRYVPPWRAVSAASLTGPLAPESLASLFGSYLAAATESADHLAPQTSLGGISLRVVDGSNTARLAPLFYVSPSQINFELPSGTATGDVTLEILNAPAQHTRAVAKVDRLAPALFSYEDNTLLGYALRIEPNGQSTVLSVRNTIVLDDRPVYLVLYATGIRNRSSVANAQCAIGATRLPVEYVGPNGSAMPGLDQVNVRLTSALKGLGLANLVLTVDGIPSNGVSVDIR